MSPRYDVVVPTVGRESLATLLVALDEAGAPRPARVVVVDDRPGVVPPLVLPELAHLAVTIVCSGGRGPAAARNAGWRRCAAPWVLFLDDDVVVGHGWARHLAGDLARADTAQEGRRVAAVGAQIVVPHPLDARLTDAERNVAALAGASYITADLAVRRAALVALGGFDERFRRAYREDTDFALRVFAAGWQIAVGNRRTEHPLRGTGTWWTSVRAQRGNADDALMRRLHGADWRRRGRAPAGGLPSHVATTTCLAVAGGAALARRPVLARIAGATWALRTARLWWNRVRPGPRTPAEWWRMAISSALIPAAACGWAVVGRGRARVLAPRGTADTWTSLPPKLVLFDRDGTLVHDVPYNGDPDAVVPVPGARAALDRLRAAGIRVGIVTNQSGVGRGLITAHQANSVTARVVELLGPFVTVQSCTHAPEAGCGCRKPAPGLILAAAADAGVVPEDCAVVGDIGADVEAALAAGARAILVPTPVTRVEEIAAAPELATNLGAAATALLDPAGAWRPASHGSRPGAAAVDRVEGLEVPA